MKVLDLGGIERQILSRSCLEEFCCEGKDAMTVHAATLTSTERQYGGPEFDEDKRAQLAPSFIDVRDCASTGRSRLRIESLQVEK
jgi:hypothetical protein